MFDFSKKTVVITGATKGIGRAAAVRFAEADARVIVIGTSDRDGAEVAGELGGSSQFIHTDITDRKQVDGLARAVADLGGVDILVNNAGIHGTGNIVETSDEAWRHIMDVNVTGMFLVTSALVPQMIEKKKGVIVNVSSEAGLVAIPGQIAYNVSKAAGVSFTKSLAVDLARYGIRANVVCPGTTMTPLVEKALANASDPQGLKRSLESSRPMNRLGTADESAMAVLAMAADELGFATGTVCSIDGGYTAQ